MNSGRPLIIWSLLLVAWIGIRVGIYEGEEQAIASPETIENTRLAGSTSRNTKSAAEIGEDSGRRSDMVFQAKGAEGHIVKKGPGNVPARVFLSTHRMFPETATTPAARQTAREFENGVNEISLPKTALPVPTTPLVLKRPPFPALLSMSDPGRDAASGNEDKDIKHGRFGLYGYSFWRPGQLSDPALAAGGQYGGSQTGVIATYQINSGKKSRLSLLGRAVLTPGNDSRLARQEWELAAGFRWQPATRIPISISAERRFRFSSPDATAIYLAASQEDVLLPVSFKLDAYAQAGVAHQRGPMKGRSTIFVDANVKIHRNILELDSTRFSLGGGAWAGGQRGARRLDVGPSATAGMEIAGTLINISADWRFRVAGDAAPGDGPAITLSTGF